MSSLLVMAPRGFAGRPLREIDDNATVVSTASVRTREDSPVVRPGFAAGSFGRKMRLKPLSWKRRSGAKAANATVGDGDDVGGTNGRDGTMARECETPKTHYGSTRDAFGTPAESLGAVDVVVDDDDDDDDATRASYDEEGAIVVRTPNETVTRGQSERAVATSTSSSLALVVELDAALERERALVDFVREQMVDCDARVGAMSLDVEDLMAALGERASAGARARWRWATRAVIETTRREKERREAKRLRARAARLEEQLRRVERYVATAAKDFDDLNAKLVTEARAAEQAREAERRALAALASARASAPDSPLSPRTTPPSVRRNNKFRAANERRAAAKAACASVAAHVEALLASSPSKQLEDLGKAQRDAARRLRDRAVPLPSSDGDDLDPSDVVALIAVHALERCSERSASDGARAFHRAAERFERVARVCLEDD